MTISTHSRDVGPMLSSPRCRAKRSIRLRNIGAASRRCLVAARLDAVQQIQEIGLQVGRVVGRRHTVDAGSTILAGEPVGLFLAPYVAKAKKGERGPIRFRMRAICSQRARPNRACFPRSAGKSGVACRRCAGVRCSTWQPKRA